MPLSDQAAGAAGQNDSSSGNFEKQFSDLAFAYLREKAPKLMDYARGFQVLDKNEDETRAAAATGFKIGNQWYVTPVFFLNGELKGHELLYIPSQDAFVPLQENWVNFLLNRRPPVLGDSGSTSEVMNGMIRPDISVYSRSPLSFGKVSGVTTGYFVRGEAWDITPFVQCFAKSSENDDFKKAAARMDLREVCRFMGIRGAAVLLKTAQNDPEFAADLMSYYDLNEIMKSASGASSSGEHYESRVNPKDGESYEAALERESKHPDFKGFLGEGTDNAGSGHYTLEEALKARSSGGKKDVRFGIARHKKSAAVMDDTAGSAVVKDEPRKAVVNESLDGKVDIIRGDDAGAYLITDLTDEERQMLVRDKIVVRDNRDQTARVYNLDLPKTFACPDGDGLFEVLIKPDQFEKMLVVKSPRTIGKGSVTGIALVRVEKDNRAIVTNANAVIARKKLESPAFKKFFEDAEDVDSMKTGESYMLISSDGQGSVPFKILERTLQNGNTHFWVKPCDLTTHMPNAMAGGLESRGYLTESCYPKSVEIIHAYPSTNISDSVEMYGDRIHDYEKMSAREIIFSKDSHGFRAAGAVLIAGSDLKVIKVDTRSRFGVTPGTFYDVQATLMKSAGLKTMNIFSTGSTYEIQHESEPQGRVLDKEAALRRLMFGYGVHYKEAQAILSQASEKGSRSYLIKSADPRVPSSVRAPSSSILDNLTAFESNINAPVQYNVGLAQKVNPHLDSFGNREIYNPDTRLDRPLLRMTAAAGDTQRKDMFDTSTLAALVKTMNSNEDIDRYVSDLMVGLDRAGRLLFMFYWHNEKFKERYGQEELRELEDALRNTFKLTGDLVLFLKKKSIDPDISIGAAEVDFGG